MQAWWLTLTPLEHLLLYLAVPATLLLVLQTLLLFLGGDAGGGESGGWGRNPRCDSPRSGWLRRPALP